MAYTAPEVLRPSGKALPFSQCAPAVDCWALGVTALELPTGCTLFRVHKKAKPSDVLFGTEDYDTWKWSCTAALHKQWVRIGCSHPSQVCAWPALMTMLTFRMHAHRHW
jgi:hypothetical protein